MPRFAANLSFLFTERPFLDRFAAAAAQGFRGVEYLFPYPHPAEALAERLAGSHLQQVLFNTPPGDWDAGERGLAALPGREAEFQEGVKQALSYARALGCPRIHVMAGIMSETVEYSALEATYRGNLAWAARRAAEAEVTLLIEPINRRDIPGYFLCTQAHARRVIDDVGAPNLKLQMDFYHCQIVEGDLTRRFEAGRELIGHIQIAGVPGRNEPDTGEVNYPHLFALMDAEGYDGWVGCEYRPRGATEAGLGWLRREMERAEG